MEDFVAIDFETANSNAYSPCSVGIAKFENGTLVDSFYSLINPEQEFDAMNIFVHGIQPEDVKNAPVYKEIYPKIENYIRGNLIVSHSSFDRNVLTKSADYYDVSPLDINFFDTLTLSRRLIPGVQHGLSQMVDYYGLSGITNFHNALEDAKACGLLAVALSSEFNCSSIIELVTNAGYKSFGKISPTEYIPFTLSRTTTVPNEFLSADDIFNRENIHKVNYDYAYIKGKNIAFTGKLQSMTRGEAETIVNSLGANFQKSVTLKTNILVVGLEDPRVVGPDGKSNKIKKAEQINSKTNNIEVIDEKEFIQYISK